MFSKKKPSGGIVNRHDVGGGSGIHPFDENGAYKRITCHKCGAYEWRNGNGGGAKMCTCAFDKRAEEKERDDLRNWYAGMALQGMYAGDAMGNVMLIENKVSEAFEVADRMMSVIENEKDSTNADDKK